MKHLAIWAGLAPILNLLWEIAQLPLYGLWSDPDPWRIAAYLMHCVFGDVLIATGFYLSTALIFRDMRWPMHRPWRGGFVMIISSLIFTAVSEWYNVYRIGAWSYAASMPLVAGIGLAPLVQWLVVPALMIVLIRRFDL